LLCWQKEWQTHRPWPAACTSRLKLSLDFVLFTRMIVWELS